MALNGAEWGRMGHMCLIRLSGTEWVLSEDKSVQMGPNKAEQGGIGPNVFEWGQIRPNKDELDQMGPIGANEA